MATSKFLDEILSFLSENKHKLDAEMPLTNEGERQRISEAIGDYIRIQNKPISTAKVKAYIL